MDSGVQKFIVHQTESREQHLSTLSTSSSIITQLTTESVAKSVIQPVTQPVTQTLGKLQKLKDLYESDMMVSQGIKMKWIINRMKA